MKLSKNYKKYLSWTIKSLILCLAFGFIYRQFVEQDQLQNIINLYSSNAIQKQWWLLVVLVLMMPLNWSIEAVKWRYLIRKIEPISFGTSFQSIFAGLTMSIFTPNRIGEFGGRILFLKDEHRITGTLICTIGSLSQFLVTIVCGSISFIFFAYQYIEVGSLGFYLIAFIVSCFIALCLLFYFNISWIWFVLSRLKIPEKYKELLHVFFDHDYWELLVIISLSLLRFGVFTLQYFLLLYFFMPDIPFSAAMMMISLIFLAQSVIPSFALADLGVRGAVSAYFLGLLTNNLLAILASSVSLWALNIIIPSLIGAWFILKINIFNASDS